MCYKFLVVSGLTLIPESVPSILRMIHQFRHTKLLKNGGRGNEPNGIMTTKPGGLALHCPACPQPSVNLPDDWMDVDPTRRYNTLG